MPSQHHHSICSKLNYCSFPKFCSTQPENNFYSLFEPQVSINFPISVNHTVIYLVLQDKNFKIILDTSLFSISHTKSNSKSYLHQHISRIWLLYLTSTAVFLVRVITISDMDYCNSLLPVGLYLLQLWNIPPITNNAFYLKGLLSLISVKLKKLFWLVLFF